MTEPVFSSLLDFLKASPTPFHAVHEAKALLATAGFSAVEEQADWSQLRPGKYWVSQAGSDLIAFIVPKTPAFFRIVGAHTDSPNLRVKPRAQYTSEGYIQWGVEVYGGALLNSWLDRDLGLAGRVFVREGGNVVSRLVLIQRPLARVPQLAIHLDREIGEKGLLLNRQDHMVPLVGLASGDSDALLSLLSAESGANASDIVSHDLMFFDLTAPTSAGIDAEFLFSARLDNLAMCHAATRALLDSAPVTDHCVSVVALFDHEEVGSASAYGAESAFLPRVLERIAKSRERFHQMIAASTCISADMAHAVHPNYAGRHEPRHKPQINKGPVIKHNAQQRYATSAASAAMFSELCKSVDVPVQHYAHRTDLPCGSTIGPITSTLLGIPTVDVGNPMLSMHSAREMAGSKDPALMVRALTKYFSA